MWHGSFRNLHELSGNFQAAGKAVGELLSNCCRLPGSACRLSECSCRLPECSCQLLESSCRFLKVVQRFFPDPSRRVQLQHYRAKTALTPNWNAYAPTTQIARARRDHEKVR